MLRNIVVKIKKLLITIIGMGGFRIDKLCPPNKKNNYYLISIWIIGIVISFFISFAIVEKFKLHGALIYFAFSWIYYYIGNILILSTKYRFNVIKSFGEEKAYSIYEVILGLMFANQALAFGAIVEENWFRWPAFEQLSIIDEIGLFLIATGVLIKIWATMVVGLDTYYYKDMFLNKSTGSFAVVGPYKYFNNPMYGMGNLQLYGLALFYFSIPGFACALLNQTSIYLFYYFAERPAIIALYDDASYD